MQPAWAALVVLCLLAAGPLPRVVARQLEQPYVGTSKGDAAQHEARHTFADLVAGAQRALRESLLPRVSGVATAGNNNVAPVLSVDEPALLAGASGQGVHELELLAAASHHHLQHQRMLESSERNSGGDDAERGTAVSEAGSQDALMDRLAVSRRSLLRHDKQSLDDGDDAAASFLPRQLRHLTRRLRGMAPAADLESSLATATSGSGSAAAGGCMSARRFRVSGRLLVDHDHDDPN